MCIVEDNTITLIDDSSSELSPGHNNSYSMFLTTAPPCDVEAHPCLSNTSCAGKRPYRRTVIGLEEPAMLPVSGTGVSQDVSSGQSAAARSAYHSHGGALKIVLLGQNDVGKSSLALSLAGQSDSSLSIDSEMRACGKDLDGD